MTLETTSPSRATIARLVAAVRKIQDDRELKARTAGLTESLDVADEKALTGWNWNHRIVRPR